MKLSQLAKPWPFREPRYGGAAEHPDLEASHPAPEADLREFLSAVSGVYIAEDAQITSTQNTYVNLIKHHVTSARLNEFKLILVSSGQHADSQFSDVLRLLRNIAQTTQNGSDFSIDNAIQSSVEAGIVSNTALQDEALQDRTRNIFFCCIAWICMLYPPVWQTTPLARSLSIDETQCDCIATSQPISNASCPLSEVIQDFGPLLPGKTEQPDFAHPMDSTFSADSLYVSLLNASTLANIGGITIRWICHLSSHLTFDPETRTLYVFAHPSYCEISSNPKSAFSGAVSSYYTAFNKPDDFTSNAFLKEIRLSYRLLFGDDSRARVRFGRQERKKLQVLGPVDPFLTRLCSGNDPIHTGGQNSYSKLIDFPILTGRLSIVQNYIQRQNPKTIKMLWKDRRNVLQWYTLWAVLLIGGVGVILAISQTGLTAAQVYFAAFPPQPS